MFSVIEEQLARVAWKAIDTNTGRIITAHDEWALYADLEDGHEYQFYRIRPEEV